ncbi:MAG: hypothetical protein KatS3mg082_2732 [Nitrospiraceae bacterium]|nr:MAG: hypothetical protein KatS3mg082_2732 [Nitrospiraceae bacterium]GIW81335.1 MAG: hypothetical protein KatS3mg105_3142 [Gemmatales bacterium]
MSLLEKLKGYRTKIAAVVIAVLAANEVIPFLPREYVHGILYLAGAGGLYFLRDAVDRLKEKVDEQVPAAKETHARPSLPSSWDAV